MRVYSKGGTPTDRAKVLKESKKAPKKKGKGSRNAFVIFRSEKRAEVKANNPNLKPRDIDKQLSSIWKKASEETKKVGEMIFILVFLNISPVFSFFGFFVGGFRSSVLFLCPPVLPAAGRGRKTALL